jgi:hypothetical protein
MVKTPHFQVGTVQTLFQTRPRLGLLNGIDPYDVSADGQRFLVNTLMQEATSAAPITIVVNWTALLKK